MVNEFKLTMHHCSFCTPKPDADLCMRVDLKIYKKTVEYQASTVKISDCWAFSPSKALPGYWAFRHSDSF